jgi:hypothetical protein
LRVPPALLELRDLQALVILALPARVQEQSHWPEF